MDARIAVVIARMEDTLEQRTNLAALAAAVNLSVSRLSHLFREEVGVSPGRYLHTIRMERSRTLLERSFLTVREVMLRVGVSDPSHFARDFRRYHGIPPSQVKRGGRAAEPAAVLLDHLNVAGRVSPGAVAAAAGAADARRASLPPEPQGVASQQPDKAAEPDVVPSWNPNPNGTEDS